MGQSVAAVRKSLTEGEEQAKDEVLQQLSFLLNAADVRLDKYEAEMEEEFLSNSLVGETEMPGLRALRWERGCRVGVSRTATKGIGEIIDAFFGVSAEETDKSGNPLPPGGGHSGARYKKEDPRLTGFKKVVEVALDGFLGYTTAGQEELRKFFIFVHHNTIIRIDVKMWRYNFVGTSVMADSENVLAYIACMSAVRHDALEVDYLVDSLREDAGDKNVNAYLEYLIFTSNNMKARPKNPSLGSEAPKPPEPEIRRIPDDDPVLRKITKAASKKEGPRKDESGLNPSADALAAGLAPSAK